MDKFKKCNHIPFPCAFPIPSEGTTGPTGPTGLPGAQGPQGIQGEPAL